METLPAFARAIRKVKPEVAWFNLGFASFGDRPICRRSGSSCALRCAPAWRASHVTLHQLFETVDLEDAAVSNNACTKPEAGWLRICF